MNIRDFSRQLVEIMPLMFREFAKREDNPLTRGAISFPQMVALDATLYREQKMNELAKLLSIKTSSATVLVDRLIREGLLTRRRDEKDRRVVWVAITVKGRKAVRRIHDQKQKSFMEMFGHLTAEERRQYLSILTKVKTRLAERMDA